MKKERKVDSISTFLGAGSSFEGAIEFQGTIRVDGKVSGKISSNGGTLIVGEKASIDADVSVSVAVVMGEVNGTIDAKDRIEVYPPGRIGGDIQAPVISIEPGGLFNGNCAMKTPDKSSTRTESTPKILPVSADSKSWKIGPGSEFKGSRLKAQRIALGYGKKPDQNFLIKLAASAVIDPVDTWNFLGRFNRWILNSPLYQMMLILH